MQKKMFKLAWALLILAGSLTATLAPKTAEALTWASNAPNAY